MKINQIIETQIDEIDRRGFLRGMGAAGAAAAMPSLARAAATATPAELKDIRLKIKSVFAKNIKVTGQEKPTANGRFQFTFDTQGRLLNKATVDSSGDANLDQAILNSATNIPPTIIALFKPSEGTKSVKIEFGAGDGWWKAGAQAGQSAQPQQQPVAQQHQNRGFSRVGNFGIIYGYKLDDIKDKIIERLLIKNPDAEVDDNGRTLTIKIHNPQSKHFGMALYKGLLGPRGSTMMVVVKFTFSERDNQIRVLPQSNIIITNAFGGVDTQPFGSSGELLDGLEKIFA